MLKQVISLAIFVDILNFFSNFFSNNLKKGGLLDMKVQNQNKKMFLAPLKLKIDQILG